MKDSLQTRLYRRWDRAPDEPALAFVDREGRFRWVTVGEAFSCAAGYASGLAQQGCGPGERCVLVLPSDEECAMVLLGALLIGSVPLLVAPPVLHHSRHSSLLSNLERSIELADPRVVVVGEHLEAACGEIVRRGGVESVFGPGRLVRGAGDLHLIDSRGSDVAALQLTSGTTGAPRICRWRQTNVLAALDGMVDAMDLGPDDVCLNWTPLYHDMGLVNNFLLCLTHGVPLAMLEPTDFVERPELWIRGLSDTESTVSWSPNFGFALAVERVGEDHLDGVRLDHVRALWNAAERIHVETMLRFHRRFSRVGLRWEALKANYGCAENVGGATFSDPHGSFRWEEVEVAALHEDRRARPARGPEARVERIASVGRPVPGVRIVIAGPDGEALPDGRIGEVLLDTPSRMLGYLGDPEGTRQAIVDGLLRTGDLGYTRDGELYWVGRVEERITVRDQNIDPSEFESLLYEIPEARPGCFAAFGIADPRLGTERPVLVCEVRSPEDRSLAEIALDIHREALERLGVWLDDVVLVPGGTLAKTSNGKRRHRYFRDAYENGEIAGLYRARPAASARSGARR